MLNLIIKRTAVAVSALWVIAMFVLALSVPHAKLLGFTFLFGVAPAAVLLGLAWLICWVLGPLGRLGDDHNRRTYEILPPER